MDKITEQDLANRGVKGLPDVPGLTTEEMQRKLEEIAREILIPKVNELVEGLNNANSNLTEKIVVNHYDLTFNNGICNIEGGQYNVVSVVPIGVEYTCSLYIVNLSPITYAVKIQENETYSGTFTCRIVYVK